MRILVVHPGAQFSVADAYEGWVEAFTELGCDVAPYNLGERLLFYSNAELEQDGERRKAFSGEAAAYLAADGIHAACYKFNPDIVFVVSCFYVSAKLLDVCRRRGSRIVILHLEEPYETDRELTRAAHADFNVINDPSHLDAFQQVSPTLYLPAAYRPGFHRPGPPVADATSDFCFVGTGFPSRIAFLEAIDWDGIDVALAGNWQCLTGESPLRKFVAHDVEACCPNEETVVLYRSTKASANFYRQEISDGGTTDGWAMSPREVELAACGTFYLTEPRGENRQVLPMIPTFDGPADFSDQLRWYLARPDITAGIATAARAAVADRTFANNARRLLELVGH